MCHLDIQLGLLHLYVAEASDNGHQRQNQSVKTGRVYFLYCQTSALQRGAIIDRLETIVSLVGITLYLLVLR